MFKKLYMLFKIGRKLSTSGAISSIYEIYKPPTLIKILFFIIGFKFNDEKKYSNLSPGKRLCTALQEMGTTFIKLGQFLATRPDIIGENISKELEKLQDKLPAFGLSEAKNVLEKELGNENCKQITKISEPIAAASIAQVHFAEVNINGKKKKCSNKNIKTKYRKVI